MELLVLAVVVGAFFAGATLGYRRGIRVATESAIVAQRIRDLGFYAPRTYQTTADGGQVETD